MELYTWTALNFVKLLSWEYRFMSNDHAVICWKWCSSAWTAKVNWPYPAPPVTIGPVGSVPWPGVTLATTLKKL